MAPYFAKLGSRVAKAFRQNRAAALVLQCVALAIAFSYFFVAETRGAFDYIAELKVRYGWQFSAVSTAIFGGVLPFVYLYLSGKIRTNLKGILFFNIVFWAYKGVEVDLFYRLQTRWFGAGNDAMTIVKKTLVDQLCYSALWAAPSIVLIYLWRDCHYNIRRWQRALTKELWTLQIPAVIASNWLIWFPAVAIVYTMPLALQIPLFNIILCFFVLLLASLSQKPENRQ